MSNYFVGLFLNLRLILVRLIQINNVYHKRRYRYSKYGLSVSVLIFRLNIPFCYS